MKTRLQNIINHQSVAAKPKVIRTNHNPPNSRLKSNGLQKNVNQSDRNETSSQQRSIRTRAQANSNPEVKMSDKKIPLYQSSDLEINRTKKDANIRIQSKSTPMVDQAKMNSSPSGKIRGNQLAEFGDYRIFVVGDLVWAKLKGWPAWPAQVSLISMT